MTGAARGGRGWIGANGWPWRRRWFGDGVAAPGRRQPSDPFTVLAVDPAADLTNDEIRSAWRRIAAATHPDRADGGDPERFAAAAAAYTELRTPSGRGEARAALAPSGTASAGTASAGTASAGTAPSGTASTAGRHRARPPGAAGQHRARRPSRAAGTLSQFAARVRGGRPVRLALRVLASCAVGTFAVLAAGPGPAGPALATGVLTWLLVTARADLS